MDMNDRPRVGFLGTGWIGRHRMAEIVATGLVEAAAVSDPSPEGVSEALAMAPGARMVGSLDEMLAMDLDGVVIATPSALHAAQSVQALEAGVAVFCQKPLGRSGAEVAAVIAAARAADRLLGVDLSYRETAAMRAIRPLVQGGELGRVFAVDLTFHNAYGPGKPWFFDRTLSGGGCLIDLGVHLADLALWTTGFPAVEAVSATLFHQGERLRAGDLRVEDYAVAEFRLAGDIAVRLACSWNLHAGRGSVIGATFYGTQGAAGFRNEAGSFEDFTAERFRGTSAELLTAPPDDWPGRAAVAWAERLARDRGYDPTCEQFAASAALLDRLYAAA